jgi:acetyltransferase-like isoleucine patch superfamily enzyme
MKEAGKLLARSIAVLIMLPAAILCAFGRIPFIFTIVAHACSRTPGILGDYVRSAFYWMTLRDFAIDARISFGTFFAHREASVGSRVYVGSYCILGRTRIGAQTQIASHVQILSGKNQHPRDESGQIQGAEHGEFVEVSVGSNCWIGAGAIVMASIGDGSTIGAGAVVTNPIPPNSVAVGNPARIIRQA